MGLMLDPVQITSRDNRRLVELRKLRNGNAGERIFLEGRRLIEEALKSGVRLHELYFADSFEDRELLDRVLERVAFAAELPGRIFDSIADTNSPQGLIVTSERPDYQLADLCSRVEAGSLPLVIMLAGVNNPSNLGAIVRTAEAADAAGVIVSRGSADAFSPKALRAGMGSSLRLPVITGLGLEEVVAWANENTFTIVATEAVSATAYTEFDWRRRNIVVFGSEAHGVGNDVKQHAAKSVKIPMLNGVESLNLGVSAGIILYEATRQNG